MSRLPRTERGARTVEMLLDRAAEVLARRGYHATSVAAICREGGLANASFYQYFADKQQVCHALVERAHAGFRAAVNGAQDLEDLCERVFDYHEEFGRPFQIFREVEFLDTGEAPRAFYDPIVRQMRALLDVDEAVAWAFLGAQLFIALHCGLWGESEAAPRPPADVAEHGAGGRPIPRQVRRAFLDFVRGGLSPTPTDCWRRLDLPEAPSTLLPQKPADGTRAQLLDAARACFASKGYAATRITEITMRAEVAQGTFYRYFPSKRDVLACVVDEIRGQIAARTALLGEGAESRLERERRTFLGFLEILGDNADIYRIVREAEFAEPPIGRDYYAAIAREYSVGVQAAQQRGEMRGSDPDCIAHILMGVAHMAGVRWVVWEQGHAAPEEARRSTLRFLMNGLQPSQKGPQP